MLMTDHRREMSLATVCGDVERLASTLHLLSDAARQRGDTDVSNALQLLARSAEETIDQLSRLLGGDS